MAEQTSFSLVVSPDQFGEHGLGNGVKSIAVDCRLLIEPDIITERDLGREPSHRCRDLGDGDERANVENLVPGQDQHASTFPTDLGEPDLAPSHISPQASASSQNGSGRSGCCS